MRKDRPEKPGKLDPFKDYIIKRLNEHSFSALRLYREIQDQGFTGKYGIVKNFIREVRLKNDVPAVYRYETKPGVQAQVDWAECSKIEIDFYRNTPMLASGIKGMRIQLRFGSELLGSSFMRRRLECPACLHRGAPPQFDLVP